MRLPVCDKETPTTEDIEMRNSVETIVIEPDADACGGQVWFDHATGKTWAVWNNGQRESWDAVKRGHSIEAAFEGFLILTDQWDRRGFQ